MARRFIIHRLLSLSFLFCLFRQLFFSCCIFLCHSLFCLRKSLLRRRIAGKFIDNSLYLSLIARIHHFRGMAIPCCLLLQLRQNRMGLGAMTRCLHGLLIGI